MESTLLIHRCSKCGAHYPLEPLPSAGERLFKTSEANISFGRYVYAMCPECGHKDWANERRFLGVLGPRSFYALAVGYMVAFLVMVYVLGFVWGK